MLGKIFIGVVVGILLIFFIYFRAIKDRYKVLDSLYGKPYKAKIVKMIGGHPQLRCGTMALSFYREAIAFNRKAFTLSQLKRVEVISQLEEYLKIVPEEEPVLKLMQSEKEKTMDSQYLLLTLEDDHGENKVLLTAQKDFQEIANELYALWYKAQFI